MNLLKAYWATLAFTSVLFVVLIVGIGYYQRPVADDLIYLKAVNHYGIWNSVMLIRDEWNTRWTAVLINQLYLFIVPKQWLGIVFQGTTLALIVAAFTPLSNFLKSNRPIFQTFLVSIFLGAGLFLLSFGHSDSWFWLCSQPAYLWSSLISFWMITRLFTGTINLPTLLLLVMGHIYVGGSSEVIALSVLMIEFSFLLFRKRLPKFDKTILTIAMAALLVSMAFAFSGDGAMVRYKHLPQPGILNGSVIAIKSYLHVLLIGIGSKIPVIFLFLMAVFPLIHSSEKRDPFNHLILIGISDLVLMVSMTITAFTLGEIGPNRVLMHISIIILGLTIYSGIQLSNKINGQHTVQLMGISVSLLLSVYFVFLIHTNFPLAKTYSEAVEKRELQIAEQINQKQEIINLSRLPTSGLLFRWDIGNDPTSPTNHQLSTIYGEELEFTVLKK